MMLWKSNPRIAKAGKKFLRAKFTAKLKHQAIRHELLRGGLTQAAAHSQHVIVRAKVQKAWGQYVRAMWAE